MRRSQAFRTRAALGGLVLLVGSLAGRTGEAAPDTGPTLAKAGVSTVAIPWAQSPKEIEISEFAFQTDTLRISVGETVRWVNRDLAPHSIEPNGEDEAWGSDLIGPGESFEHRFDSEGEYPYRCGPHPFMRAVVIVGEPGRPVPSPAETR